MDAGHPFNRRLLLNNFTKMQRLLQPNVCTFFFIFIKKRYQMFYKINHRILWLAMAKVKRKMCY